MRRRKQNGTIVRIGENWHVRYWERVNVSGEIVRKKKSHLPNTSSGASPDQRPGRGVRRGVWSVSRSRPKRKSACRNCWI